MPEAVSVIICTYNCAHFLRQCLESVTQQTRPPDEVIVVDDGSKDETPEVVAAFRSVRYLRQENAGKAAAFNRGFAAAKGDIICHLDADDYWLPEKLSRAMEVLSSFPVGIVTHDAFYVDGKGNFLYGSELGLDGEAPLRQLSLQDILPMCFVYRPYNAARGSLGVANTVCVKREAVADFLPLPESLGLAVDGALLLGAARKGLIYVPKKLSAYRHHESNHFVRDPRSLEFQRRLFRWISEVPGIGEAREKRLLEVLAFETEVQAAMTLGKRPLNTAFKAAALPPRLLLLGLIPHWKQYALPAASLLQWRKIRGVLQRAAHLLS